LILVICMSCDEDMDTMNPIDIMDPVLSETWISTISSQLDVSYSIDMDIDAESNYLFATELGIGTFDASGVEASFLPNALRVDDDRRALSFVHNDMVYRFYSYRINRRDDNPFILLEVIDKEGQIIESVDLPKRQFLLDVHFYSDREMAVLSFNPSRIAVELMRFSIDRGMLADVVVSRNQSDAPSRLYVSPSGTLYPYWSGVFDNFDNFFRVNSNYQVELNTQLPMAIYGLSALNENELFAVATRDRGAETAVMRLNREGDILSENSWPQDGLEEIRPSSIVHTDSHVFTQEWTVELSDQLRIRSFDHNLGERETTLVDGYIGYSNIVLNEVGGISFFHGARASDDSFNPRVVKMGADGLLPETLYDN